MLITRTQDPFLPDKYTYTFIREYWWEWLYFYVDRHFAYEPLPWGYFAYDFDEARNRYTFCLLPLIPFAFAYKLVKFCWLRLAIAAYRSGHLDKKEGDAITWWWPVYLRITKRHD